MSWYKKLILSSYSVPEDTWRGKYQNNYYEFLPPFGHPARDYVQKLRAAVTFQRWTDYEVIIDDMKDDPEITDKMMQSAITQSTQAQLL